jgi:ComF family protein
MAQKYLNQTYIGTLLTDFIALLYPEICIGCENILQKTDDMICLSCSVEMPRTYFESKPHNPVERLFWFKTKITAAAAIYFFTKKSRIQNMIHAFKYKNNPDAAIYLGRQLGEILIKSGRFQQIDVIIPVPLHPDKFKIRGYNQAQKIAEGIQQEMNIPINTHALIRTNHNPTQTQKNLYHRWKNVNTIFKVTIPQALEEKHVLLVDDVITSGSTLEACAQKLVALPSTHVSIATLAVAIG